jgi:hypothetical protein
MVPTGRPSAEIQPEGCRPGLPFSRGPRPCPRIPMYRSTVRSSTRSADVIDLWRQLTPVFRAHSCDLSLPPQPVLLTYFILNTRQSSGSARRRRLGADATVASYTVLVSSSTHLPISSSFSKRFLGSLPSRQAYNAAQSVRINWGGQIGFGRMMACGLDQDRHVIRAECRNTCTGKSRSLPTAFQDDRVTLYLRMDTFGFPPHQSRRCETPALIGLEFGSVCFALRSPVIKETAERRRRADSVLASRRSAIPSSGDWLGGGGGVVSESLWNGVVSIAPSTPQDECPYNDRPLLETSDRVLLSVGWGWSPCLDDGGPLGRCYRQRPVSLFQKMARVRLNLGQASTWRHDPLGPTRFAKATVASFHLLQHCSYVRSCSI